MSGVSPRFDLSGRTAVVTGASRGIGAAIAVALAEAGADVVGVSRSADPDGPTGAAVRACGRAFSGISADLADRAQTLALADELVALGPDILMINHGISLRTPAIDYPMAMWDEVLETNLHSAWILAQAVGREMVARGSGKIILTASMLSYQGGITVPAYAASKHGVAGLVKALSNEWAAAGVQINAIAPGYIDTDINTQLMADPEREPQIRTRIPAGRWGRPEDIAGAAVFLAAPASDYVSGTMLAVDGGWLGR